MKNSKVFSLVTLGLTLTLLLLAAAATAVIDPYFHYHAPVESLQYPLYSQRYQNDGIVRHFSYDALITGTSMTENFKTSEFDRLFGVNSVKVTYSGGTYEEITDNLRQALEHNPGIRYVLFGLEEWFLFSGRDLIQAEGEYPTYLYDDDPFNDVKYLLNKEILANDTLEVLAYTKSGGVTTSFDDYSSWDLPTGREAVLAGYARAEKSAQEQTLTEEQTQTLESNARGTLVQLAKAYPDTQFLCFFPPYSILNWDDHRQTGSLKRIVEGMALGAEILMEQPNIQVFSFYTDYETITDLENYRDIVHYHSGINSLLLERMAKGAYRLTPETNQAHWEQVLAFYESYDYDAIFE